MAWSCTLSTNPTGCGHYVVTARRDDGTTLVVPIHETEAAEPLTQVEEVQLVQLTVRRLRASGVLLAAQAGRVLLGSEATNVRSYDFLGPGAAITKTNIGTAYVNICPGLNGERLLVDLTGASEFRIVVTATLTGTGPFGLRCVRDSDDAVVFENAAIALTGNQELDTGWQPIPIAVGTLVLLRLQAKSVVGTDDPVFRRATILIQ